MWVGGFCLHGRTKKKNARVLKYITSFLSNNSGPSNSTQQWGLKPLEEELVKDEVISYNEGYRVHIHKELAIFPNSHKKSDQAAIAAHNCHLIICPKIWSLGTSVKVQHLYFWPKKWVTGWISSKRWVPQGGHIEQLGLSLQPFMGISLPYGVRNT
jgi:hypothetical protein